ncbi:hypothetical protein [Streptomyces sp. NPDC058657]|uniref:hypothetical protein n=1 Tax=Streptomyces sp. NPDC058657 TaxID=3346579 RepID=UPI003664E38F
MATSRSLLLSSIRDPASSRRRHHANAAQILSVGIRIPPVAVAMGRTTGGLSTRA